MNILSRKQKSHHKANKPLNPNDSSVIFAFWWEEDRHKKQMIIKAIICAPMHPDIGKENN